MFKTSNYIILLFIGFLFVMCKQKEKNNVKNESILKGSTTILVDETLTPIIEDQIEVFESKYNAKINIV
jgi:phosphate transport system substrate-binding protein